MGVTTSLRNRVLNHLYCYQGQLGLGKEGLRKVHYVHERSREVMESLLRVMDGPWGHARSMRVNEGS